jgi:sigma-B regulation protein RsbU (phosphoserine phosphatase)
MAGDSLSFLAQNKLLQGLTETQLRRVGGGARLLAFPTGATIIRQAAPADTVFLIVEGMVEVRRALPGSEESTIAELGAGEFCGEMAVIIGVAQHSASVLALTEVKALALKAEDFTRLLGEFPEITRNVLSNIVLQLQGVNMRWLETLRAEKEMLERKVRERTQELEEVGQRVRRELMLAQNIQRNLLPEKRRSWPGITIATEYIPCTELGGDITGVFPIDETRLGVYGGDVCGHGIYAAMVMSYVKKLIETSFKRILLNRQYVVKPPGAVLTTINQSFITEINQGDPEIYLTLFLGVLDINRLTLEYASAGTHCPPLVLSRGSAAPLFTQSDFSIGHVPNHEYATSRQAFAPGDVFLFVSDGVIEAQRDGEVFGMERLKRDAVQIMSTSGSLDAEAVVKSVREFLRGEPPQDDMCLLTIEFQDPPG